jgi:hypothetical protein
MIGSICWAAYLVWRSDIACPLRLIGITIETGPWCEYQIAEPLTYYGGLVARMVGVPLVVGGALLAIAWIVAGFQRHISKNSN